MSKKVLMWPPPYTLTPMKQVSEVTIKITLKKGLEFIVPKRFNKKAIPKLLKINRLWIQQQFKVISQDLYKIKMAPLPKKICLAAVWQSWKVKYRSLPSDRDILENKKQKTLILSGNIKNKQDCKKRLCAWIKRQARKRLISKLQYVSNKIGLKFNDVVIRNQSSRWGSCSSGKKISLNYKLIFLPDSLCKHVLIHELCHTVHLNHSKRFWRLLAKHDANWEKHYQALQLAEKLIPVWTTDLPSS